MDVSVDDGTRESWPGMHQKESSCLVPNAGNPQKFIERDGVQAFVDSVLKDVLGRLSDQIVLAELETLGEFNHPF